MTIQFAPVSKQWLSDVLDIVILPLFLLGIGFSIVSIMLGGAVWLYLSLGTLFAAGYLANLVTKDEANNESNIDRKV